MALLEIKDLRTEIATRGGAVRAVDGVSLTVDAGETLGLVGESGSGKSMIANSIMRLLPDGGAVTAGSIALDGQDLTALPDARLRKVRGAQIGLVFQDPMSSLDPTMTIGNQIAESVRYHRGVDRDSARARAAEVLDLVAMPRAAQRLDDYPHQLSGGLRQRVVIAMALACEPKLLIADEPTTALDVTIQAQILDLLDDLKARLGMAMLLITHDLGVVAERTDRVAVLYAGSVVESAATDELFRRIEHPYTESLLASIPTLTSNRGERLFSIPGLPPDLRRLPQGCRFAARCAHASGDCRKLVPALAPVGNDHTVACFHPRAGAGFGLRVTGGALRQTGTAATAAPGPLLELRDVSKVFPVKGNGLLRRTTAELQAVTGVSLTVAKGETVGLVGESGCGKTTLGRIATTLERLSAGEVLFEGTDLAHLRESELRRFRRDIQLVFQDPYSSLDPRMRVGALIREPLVWNKLGDHATQKDRVLELLDQVGLPRSAVNRYPHEFSGGQRQRIAIARALALNPKLIVADEPVSALDVSIRSQILNLLKDLQAEYQLTSLVISHDLSVVRYIADRVAVMYLGKIVETGSGDEIYEAPAHPYTAGLLEAIPLPDPAPRTRHTRLRGELPSAIDPPSGCRFRLRCQFATELCAREAPELKIVRGGQQVACHFPLAASETAGIETHA